MATFEAGEEVTEPKMELAGTITVTQLYICNYCENNFTSEKERYAHQVDAHWKEMISQCEVCVKSFLLKQEPDPTHRCNLQNPSETSPSPNRVDTLSHANENRTTRKVKTEKKAVSAKKKVPKPSQTMIFTCNMCKSMCKSVLEMLTHKQSHHESTTQCHHCHLSCRNEQSLVEHLKLHVNQPWHVCTTCGAGFDREASLLDHKKSEHALCDTQLDTGIPGKQELEEQLLLETNNWIEEPDALIAVTQKRMYLCRYCLKKFSDQVDYHDHVTISHPKKYHCDVCDKAFVRRCEVRLHMKHHCEERSFVCQYCAKSFKRQTHLDCHILSHTGEKKFQCKECGKSFKAKRTLIGHEMKHLGEQPYQCKDCGVKFTLKSSLVKHEECHSASRVRVRCPKCDKDFCSKESLVIHDKAVHLKIKQFVCETCGTGFSYQSHLKKHQMIHRNEKPFKCSFCDKAFRLAYSRMIHESEHTGKKPHQCELCSKQYATKARLERHQKTHVRPVVLKQEDHTATRDVQLPTVATIQVTGYDSHLTPDSSSYRQHQDLGQTPNTEEQGTAAGTALLMCTICRKGFMSYCDWMAHHHTHNPAQLNHINMTQDTVSVMLSLMSSAS